MTVADTAVLPRDREDPRFVASVAVGDAEGLREFFDRFGVVVIRDVLAPAECDATLDALWDIVEAQAPAVDRRDRATWGAVVPSMNRYGMATYDSIFSPALLCNRENPKLYWAFRTLLGDDRLLVSHDRGCIYRPTRGAPRSWRTVGGVHLDMNPQAYHLDPDGLGLAVPSLEELTYGPPGTPGCRHFIEENNHVIRNHGLHLQGSLNLLDNLDEDGGFVCVPGFHRRFDEWAASAGEMDRRASFGFTKKRFPDICASAVRVAVRAGSAVIWHQTLPHGSAPNYSDNPRAAVFVRMLRQQTCTSSRLAKRTAVLRGILADIGYEPTPLGRSLFFGEPPDAIHA